MNVSTSFSFPEEFKKKLDELCMYSGKTRTQYVIEAVEKHSDGNPEGGALVIQLESMKLLYSELQEKLDDMKTQYDAISSELRTIRVLCAQILENQLSRSNSV